MRQIFVILFMMTVVYISADSNADTSFQNVFLKNKKVKEIKLTDIQGIKLGHAQSEKGGTGCSVVIAESGATGGVAVRGGAPGTRETDLLNPMELVQTIHAVVLSGGSAYGLDACSGVMQYLESKDIGFDVEVAKVPIVCGAVLFDLAFSDPKIRPDKEMGFAACQNAETFKDDREGNIGAGYGATVGKFTGMSNAMKSGLGTYAIQIGDLQVGAIVAVNCLGDVVDPETGKIIAGVYDRDKKTFKSTEQILIDSVDKEKDPFKGNTTIGIVITNAVLDKSQANKIASMSHNAYARTMYPAHTMYDGDTIFTMATNQVKCDTTTLGMLMTRVMEQAVLNAVNNAEPLNGYPSAKSIRK
ncbi:MAG TPA: P1 family peptidase [Candidatus Cloacimonadota bacterium]|nr:P1 family peptidase [Candidatus Cloacimonadota bacterium]